MRRLRRILAAVILILTAAVTVIYLRQKAIVEANREPAPPPLPKGVQATTKGGEWHWEQAAGDRPLVQISAKGMRHAGDRIELEGVTLRLYHKDGKLFDKVTSAKAEFRLGDRALYSEGNVEISMGLTEGDVAAGKLVTIHCSGVTFDTSSGKASTERAVQFTLDTADGTAVGAVYDPQARELQLKDKVEIAWRGRNGKSAPMKVETGHLLYREADAYIMLQPWAKLTRGTFTLESQGGVVYLENGEIRKLDATKAQGTDRQPKRTVEYGADNMHIDFAEKGEISKIEGENNARLVSTASTGQTTVNAHRVDMFFAPSPDGSKLDKADVRGKASITSKPAQGETRVLRSEVIEMKMRPGGEDIQTVVTKAAGKLEFLPNSEKQRQRTLDAESIVITYAPENRIEKFEAVAASTRTEGRLKEPPLLTWSKNLRADFDPKTQDVAKMEQWENFRFEQGESKGNSERAIMQGEKQEITLSGRARVWDLTGSTAADNILLDQRTGDFGAEGNVASTRQPDKKSTTSAPLLSGDAPMQARAKKMTSSGGNAVITYTGGVVLWQGSNRLEAEKVDIERAKQRLKADGSVTTYLLDNAPSRKAEPKPKPEAPVMTTVKAAALVYDGVAKVADYSGDVAMRRPDLVMESQKMRVHLREAKEGTSFEKIVCDTDVRITQKRPASVRNGSSDHGEYFADEEKLVLSGGSPQLTDSVKGTTRGRQLTIFAGNDRLLVDGGTAQPAVSRIKRKK